jgi:hypothetical protein
LDGLKFLRPYGTFSHPNIMGGFYLLTYIFFFVWKPQKEYAILRNLVLFVSMLLIVLSFSKSAIVVFILFQLSVFWTVFKTSSCKYCRVARVFVLLAVAVVFIMPRGDVVSLDKRMFLVDSAIWIIFHNPLAGVGLGNYLYSQASFVPPFSGYFLQPVHNIFLLAIAELGIPLGGGIIVYLCGKISGLVSKYGFGWVFLAVFCTGMVDHYWITQQQTLLLAGVFCGMVLNSILTLSKNTFTMNYGKEKTLQTNF